MEFNFAFVVELPFKAVVSPVYYKFLIFTFQVMIIEKSGMTLNVLVPDGFHSLLRAVVSNMAVNKASTTESKSPEADTEIPLDEAMNQLETLFIDIAMSDVEIDDEIVLLEKSVQQADLIESAEDADLTDTSSPREVGNVTASYNLDDYIIIDSDSEEFLAPKVRNVCEILTLEKSDVLTIGSSKQQEESQEKKQTPPEQLHFEDPDFSLAGDNVNLSTKRRKTSRKGKNKQLNLFNIVATKNRVPYNGEKVSRDQSRESDEVPLSYYFMSKEDNTALRGEFRHLVFTTLTELREDLAWMKKFRDSCIKHKYMMHTRKKSEVVSRKQI